MGRRKLYNVHFKRCNFQNHKSTSSNSPSFFFNLPTISLFFINTHFPENSILQLLLNRSTKFVYHSLHLHDPPLKYNICSAMYNKAYTRIFHIANLKTKLGLVFCSRWYSTTEKGKRFAALWGNGDYGRLGLGNVNSQWKPVACSAFNGDLLRSISCGGAHTLFLTESGRVYASGLNDFGQLGISDDKDYSMEPTKISGIKKDVKQIFAGYCHSCAITVDGELYMWGKNSNGQLGLGKSAPKAVSTPTIVKCLTGLSIETAALGSEHSIAVTDEGVTLSWGGENSGRLGHERQSGLFNFISCKSEYTPRIIKRLEGIKITAVAAGLMHSACIDENGNVFVFGEGKLNKLNARNSVDVTRLPMLSDLPIAKDVACGGYHTCVITRNGELYTWGSNENGCLGIGCTDVIHSPERVEGPFVRQSVNKVSCGWKHTAAIADGYVFTWGWGGSHGTFSVDGSWD
ncbi:ultraviolet-B receptor UVR8 isoform X2 [Amaranthus tricolor]|uniref:ultraviolet-B receptor UVR8 isoform X2 n=1 Tax=Amaranthus tricolor TaxID=29722 RepID=UPI0025891236|nr:ultraviolet-B receptor UVR8 isoform X2 [Amaranthus tricolor]